MTHELPPKRYFILPKKKVLNIKKEKKFQRLSEEDANTPLHVPLHPEHSPASIYTHSSKHYHQVWQRTKKAEIFKYHHLQAR